jgi:hypothetical protein
VTSLTLVVTALGALGWWRWWKTASHECEAVPQVLTPWLAPDLEADRPPKRYISCDCVDPTCDVTVDLPVQVTVRHEKGAVTVKVTADTTDLAAHECSHSWAA